MVKVILKDKKSLENAKKRMSGIVDFRKTKNGIVVVKTKTQNKAKIPPKAGPRD